MNMHLLLYICAPWKVALPLSTGGDIEILHVCMGSSVYNEEAEVNHRCLITLNVMCLATTAKYETSVQNLVV